jgi:hypothetical protein
MASMNYFDSDKNNSTNTAVYFDGKDGNLYKNVLTFAGNVAHNFCCQIQETSTHQHILLRQESRST